MALLSKPFVQLRQALVLLQLRLMLHSAFFGGHAQYGR